MFRPTNKNAAIIKIPAVILLVIFIFSRQAPLNAESSMLLHQGRTVRIMILSKNLHEIEGNASRSVVLSFPEDTCADTGLEKIPLRKLEIRQIEGRFILAYRGVVLNNSAVTIECTRPGACFTFTTQGDTRRYPLPLEITCTGNGLKLVVTENIMQYAIDSAAAELGAYDDTKTEALYALAHAVLGRSLCAAEGTRHPGAHFCDLTCCQCYRGRSRFEFNDPVTVSPDCGSRIFFGSSGGGIILTERVFGTSTAGDAHPLPDVIYSENCTLSRNIHPSWRADISSDELNTILYAATRKRTSAIIYSPENESMILDTYEGPYRIAPETFRLTINRVKGWSFIKSNNYNVRSENGVFIFRGSGLGHCAGMSIEGAIQLAQKGYSRYEILEHYYPWISYNIPDGNPGCQYHRFITFDLRSGRITGNPAMAPFFKRRIPFGSVSKLVTVLYMAAERRDLFYNYRFTCAPEHSDRNIPEKCWEPGGHGIIDLRSAIYNSCNIYFASLYSSIDMKKYYAWVKNFAAETGIDLDMPQISTGSGFASLLSGTDFRLTVSIKGLMRLTMLLSPCGCSDPGLSSFRNKIRTEEFMFIHDALRATMSIGTGSHMSNDSLRREETAFTQAWGKTGTVISGTNSHCGYGIFIGGGDTYGIVSILRKGTGAMAAGYSVKVLELKCR